MRLPVSGLEVGFRAPDGNDDLAILEAAGSAVERALAVLPRLVQAPEMAGDAVESRGRGPWAALTVTDFETALLGLRRFLFGDAITCLFRDRSHKCGVPAQRGRPALVSSARRRGALPAADGGGSVAGAG